MPSSLEDARAGLEDGRAKLGAWLLLSIGAQDVQIARLQAAIAPRRQPRPAAPAKIVVDDGPELQSRTRRNPPPPRHLSNVFCGTSCPSAGV